MKRKRLYLLPITALLLSGFCFSVITAASIEPGDRTAIDWRVEEERDEPTPAPTPVPRPEKSEPVRRPSRKGPSTWDRIGTYLPDIIGAIGTMGGSDTNDDAADPTRGPGWDWDRSGGGGYRIPPAPPVEPNEPEPNVPEPDRPAQEDRQGEKAYAYVDYYDTAGRKIHATRTITGIEGDIIHGDSYVIHIATFRYVRSEPSSVTLERDSRKSIRLVYEKEQTGSR